MSLKKINKSEQKDGSKKVKRIRLRISLVAFAILNLSVFVVKPIFNTYKKSKINSYIEARDIDELKSFNKLFTTKDNFLLYESLEECLKYEDISSCTLDDIIETIRTNKNLDIDIDFDVKDVNYDKINLQDVIIEIVNDIYKKNPDFNFSLMNYNLKNYKIEFDSKEKLKGAIAYCDHNNKKIILHEFKNIEGNSISEKFSKFKSMITQGLYYLRNFYKNGNRAYDAGTYRENGKVYSWGVINDATIISETTSDSIYCFESEIVRLLDDILDYEKEIDLFKEMREGNVKNVVNLINDLYEKTTVPEGEEYKGNSRELLELLEIYAKTPKTNIVDDINYDTEIKNGEYPISNYRDIYLNLFEIIKLSELYKLNKTEKNIDNYIAYSKEIYYWSETLKKINKNNNVINNEIKDIMETTIIFNYIYTCFDGMTSCGMDSDSVFSFKSNEEILLPTDLYAVIVKDYRSGETKIDFTTKEKKESFSYDEKTYIGTGCVYIKDYIRYIANSNSLSTNKFDIDSPCLDSSYFEDEVLEKYFEKQKGKSYSINYKI
jgi:hypothetical protein